MFFADFLNLLVELVELVDCTSYVESKAAESARPPNLTTSECLLFCSMSRILEWCPSSLWACFGVPVLSFEVGK
jgi:hypothetical protein